MIAATRKGRDLDTGREHRGWFSASQLTSDYVEANGIHLVITHPHF